MNARAACLVLAVSAGIALARCGAGAPPPEPLRPVRYVVVAEAEEILPRYYSGLAKAAIESRLSFKVPGTIDSLHVSVGDAVAAGQLIAALNPTDYALQVQEAEAALSRGMADARNAAAVYRRVQQLYENQNASKSELDGARAAAEASAAQVRSIQKQLELARRQVEYTRLHAPLDGNITLVPAEVNENVQAGQPVAVLASTGDTEVAITAPEGDIASIAAGDAAQVRFDAVPGAVYEAVVTEVGVASGTFSTTYPVTLRLREHDPRLRPGMAAEAALFLAPAEAGARLHVPAAAVRDSGAGRTVFVLEDGGPGKAVARERPVETGQLTRHGIEVLAGLAPGDRVITAGVSRIRDGQEVRAPGAPDAP